MPKYVVTSDYIGDNYKAGQVVEFDHLPPHFKYVMIPISQDENLTLEVATPNPKPRKPRTKKEPSE